MNFLFQDTQLLSLKEKPREEISFEGANLKHVLIITRSSLTKDERAFLAKVLGAVKLELNDVAILTSENAPLFHQLKSVIRFSKVLLFGITPIQLGLNIRYENYLPVHFLDTDMLVADNLAIIQDNDPSKTLLWKSLKKMFLENVPG